MRTEHVMRQLLIILVVGCTPLIAPAASAQQGGGWSSWANYGGDYWSAPSCVQMPRTTAQIYCEAIVADSAGGRGWFGFAFVVNTYTPGAVTPAAASTHPGNCLILSTSTPGVYDRACFNRSPAPDWNAVMRRWDSTDSLVETRNLGGYLQSTPTCFSLAANTIDCFAKMGEVLANVSRVDGTWGSNWIYLGGHTTLDNPHSCMASTATQIDCFVVGPDSAGNQNALLNISFDVSNRAAWPAARWRSAGGNLSGGAPSCVITAAVAIECMARGADGTMQSKSRMAGTWSSSWNSHSGDVLASPVSCLSTYGRVMRDPSVEILCVSLGSSGGMKYRTKTASGWQPPVDLGGSLSGTLPRCYFIGGPVQGGETFACLGLGAGWTLNAIFSR